MSCAKRQEILHKEFLIKVIPFPSGFSSGNLRLKILDAADSSFETLLIQSSHNNH